MLSDLMREYDRPVFTSKDGWKRKDNILKLSERGRSNYWLSKRKRNTVKIRDSIEKMRL